MSLPRRVGGAVPARLPTDRTKANGRNKFPGASSQRPPSNDHEILIGAPGFTGTVWTMDIDLARDFVRRHHRAVLTTYYPDARAQLSPVTVGVDEAGDVVISTRETATKTRNLSRDPRVVICALTDAFFGDWVLIEGRASIIHLPEAMEPLVDYYRGISGEHPDWDDYRAAMVHDQRVLLRVTVTRAGPDRHG